MASHRPYERLLQQAQRLTQRDEYWAGTTRLARMWVTPKKAPPYRPYITLWLSQDGKIVASKAHQHPPSADELATELLQAMRRPALGAGRARRPRTEGGAAGRGGDAGAAALRELRVRLARRQPAGAQADEPVQGAEADEPGAERHEAEEPPERLRPGEDERHEGEAEDDPDGAVEGSFVRHVVFLLARGEAGPRAEDSGNRARARAG